MRQELELRVVGGLSRSILDRVDMLREELKAARALDQGELATLSAGFIWQAHARLRATQAPGRNGTQGGKI
jgi:hypothetical protein